MSLDRGGLFMSQNQNRILTTHVGSLIRPPELLARMEARQEGKSVDDGIFADTLRHSVVEVVRQQADAGRDNPPFPMPTTARMKRH
jgi:5-methyltetrahydropteroyltriglutamate--homocysteine methyltransferase